MVRSQEPKCFQTNAVQRRAIICKDTGWYSDSDYRAMVLKADYVDYGNRLTEVRKGKGTDKISIQKIHDPGRNICTAFLGKHRRPPSQFGSVLR